MNLPPAQPRSDGHSYRCPRWPRIRVGLFDFAPAKITAIIDRAAYLICRLIPEPHHQENYDLFLAEAVAAWADARVFRDGHWHFDDVGDDLKTLHYVAGGQFYRIGSGLNVGHSSG